MDVQAAFFDHDETGEGPITKIDDWSESEKWVESGGESSARAEIVSAWIENESDEKGFDDEVKAQTAQEQSNV